MPTQWGEEVDQTRLAFKVDDALEVILAELADQLAALGDGVVIGLLRTQRDTATAEREAQAAVPPELVDLIDDSNDEAIPTGMPGRPAKGKAWIEAEFERRIKENACETELKEEAEALLQLYKKKYPKAESPTVKTIMNNVRARHRHWRATRPPEAS